MTAQTEKRQAEPSGLAQFLDQARHLLGKDSVLTDDFSLAIHGADASPYHLVPKAVVLVESEEDVSGICASASALNVPITFRAAGTSLSGQGVTDSVLVKLGRHGFRAFQSSPDGSWATLGPALVGGYVNARLHNHNRKIGPDPASLSAAMVGGIVANNSSGMCCGTEQNAYKTVRAMRLVMADGTRLDTGSPTSREAFRRSHPALLAGLAEMAEEVGKDSDLSAMIARKYKIKNTTGYSLNALVDFTDPFDILTHLVVGSEGTLAFISEVTLETVPEPRHKAAALAMFANFESACQAAMHLKSQAVSAVEIMDFASLASVIGQPGIDYTKDTLAEGSAALLIDIRAENHDELAALGQRISQSLLQIAPDVALSFSTDPVVYANYWSIRKGLLPSVGGVRPKGTTVIVEDVAVPMEKLADTAKGLRASFDKHGYKDAIIFGHALDGNLHFVFPQSFGSTKEIDRFAALTVEITKLVATDMGGSLKAEHGTGRSMAPFVELEWGQKAYDLMWQIKALFDPFGILSPGVVLSRDKDIYLKSLKALPEVDDTVDRCIECGFCEPVCPSRHITTTPRQRIVASRARERLRNDGASALRLAQFERTFAYEAVETCAGDGLCSKACPVAIDTGEVMRNERASRRSDAGKAVAHVIEKNVPAIMALGRAGLGLADGVHAIVGAKVVSTAAGTINRISRAVPAWTPDFPTPGKKPPRFNRNRANAKRVVLFSSCVSSAMAPARGAPDPRPLWRVVGDLFRRAGLEVAHAGADETGCCGMPFNSKGFFDTARESAHTLAGRLNDFSDGDIIVSDTSPCSQFLATTTDIALMDLTRALHDLVLPNIDILRRAPSIALHVTCSTHKLGEAPLLEAIARACAQDVIVPLDIACCGFAGDKGMSNPELNASALRSLKEQLPPSCKRGYSTSRTCEIGLSSHSGRAYQSIAYLLDWCTSETAVPWPANEYSTLAF